MSLLAIIPPSRRRPWRLLFLGPLTLPISFAVVAPFSAELSVPLFIASLASIASFLIPLALIGRHRRNIDVAHRKQRSLCPVCNHTMADDANVNACQECGTRVNHAMNKMISMRYGALVRGRRRDFPVGWNKSIGSGATFTSTCIRTVPILLLVLSIGYLSVISVVFGGDALAAILFGTLFAAVTLLSCWFLFMINFGFAAVTSSTLVKARLQIDPETMDPPVKGDGSNTDHVQFWLEHGPLAWDVVGVHGGEVVRVGQRIRGTITCPADRELDMASVRCSMTGPNCALFITYPDCGMGHNLLCCKRCGGVHAFDIQMELYLVPKLAKHLHSVDCAYCGECLGGNWAEYPETYMDESGQLRTFERPPRYPDDEYTFFKEFPDVLS